MKFELLKLLALLVVLALLLPVAINLGKSLFRSIAVNSIVKTHENGKISRACEEAFAIRHLLCKVGTAPGTQVKICTDGDVPLGVLQDEATAADVTDASPRTVALLGVTPGTIKMVASAAITAGAKVYTEDGGKVQPITVAAGTYYEVGTALTAASTDGDEIEVAHCYPIATVITE